MIPLKIGNLQTNGLTVLAPMAGVTDYAYRAICAELGAAVTVTEMVSSRALVYQDKKSVGLLKKTPVGLCGAQIFGNDPEIMGQGLGRLAQHRAASRPGLSAIAPGGRAGAPPVC